MSEDLKNEQQAAEEQETVENQAAEDQTSDNQTEEVEATEEVQELPELSAIEQLQLKVVELKNTLLRTEADRQNIKKRAEDSRVRTFEMAKKDVVSDFTPIYEELKAVLEENDEAKADDTFVEGIKMVSNKFQQTLEK